MTDHELVDEVDALADLCDRLATSARRQHLSRIRAAVVGIGAVAALGFGFTAATAIADSPNDAPVTPATAIHGLPGNNPGFGGGGVRGACPTTIDGCDGGLHNIAGVVANGTGQPADEPPACTAHGGLDTKNANCQ